MQVDMRVNSPIYSSTFFLLIGMAMPRYTKGNNDKVRVQRMYSLPEDLHLQLSEAADGDFRTKSGQLEHILREHFGNEPRAKAPEAA